MGERLRVAVVVERYASGGGGQERSTRQIVAELRERGHAVRVLTAVGEHGRGEAEGEAGETVEAMGLSGLRTWLHVWRYHRWVERRLEALSDAVDVSIGMSTAAPADVVQPRGGTVVETMERNVAIRAAGWRRGVKRATQRLLPKQAALVWAERKTLGHARLRRVVAVSDYVARQLDEHYGIGGDRVVVVPNAAAMPEMDEAKRARKRAALRAGLGVAEDAVVFLFSALKPRLKGLGTLTEAVRLLQARGVEGFSVWVAGSGGYRLHDGLRRAGVSERFVELGPTRSMAELYAAADVTVLPTFYDPSSKVVIESLMMGVPAITTRFNGAADFVVPGGGAADRGVVIDDPGDAGALAEAMVGMMDEQRRRACARAIGDELVEELGMARHVGRLEEVLGEVARGGI
ncbi:MAG: glycosyltransferase family 4 protein [Planctomycetota bacterium]